MSSPEQRNLSGKRRGAVGVLVEEDRFLVIRRSPFVRAPNLICFPGGSIEPGETAENAVIREMQEELGLLVSIEQKLWKSVTGWGTELDWFLLKGPPIIQPVPDPKEVSEVFWTHPLDLLGRNDLLGSVHDFFRAIHLGEIAIGPPNNSQDWSHLIRSQSKSPP
jgi:8-oxo-dGTP pyrophosphatase MutT (NUDIX family)